MLYGRKFGVSEFLRTSSAPEGVKALHVLLVDLDSFDAVDVGLRRPERMSARTQNMDSYDSYVGRRHEHLDLALDSCEVVPLHASSAHPFAGKLPQRLLVGADDQPAHELGRRLADIYLGRESEVDPRESSAAESAGQDEKVADGPWPFRGTFGAR